MTEQILGDESTDDMTEQELEDFIESMTEEDSYLEQADDGEGQN